MYYVYVVIVIVIGCFDDDWVVDFMGNFGVGYDVIV